MQHCNNIGSFRKLIAGDVEARASCEDKDKHCVDEGHAEHGLVHFHLLVRVGRGKAGLHNRVYYSTQEECNRKPHIPRHFGGWRELYRGHRLFS